MIDNFDTNGTSGRGPENRVVPVSDGFAEKVTVLGYPVSLPGHGVDTGKNDFESTKGCGTLRRMNFDVKSRT